ncbi:hypothetical protein [Paraburkholderia terrae]|uniref:hypothetical protein n=1 Tax=Paraburkholderia terrae TaxID=311230 RepID=UPI002049DACD|nr:hypothetical protein [Paraburkholderia terrae]BDC46002.1 hypothetical protein PTKU15_92990 [Paraburkholderia terrae]
MELASLHAFLNAPAPISARVLVGGEGSGKTRLALELCEQASATCIFAIVVWGAFREANKIVSKKRSAVAGILYIVALLFQTPIVLSVEAQLSDLGIAHQSTATK